MLIISRPVVTRNVGSGISAVIGRVTDGFLSVQQTISLWTGSLFGEKIAREGKEGGGGERGLFTFPSPQFPARPKACSQASRQSARAPLPPSTTYSGLKRLNLPLVLRKSQAGLIVTRFRARACLANFWRLRDIGTNYSEVIILTARFRGVRGYVG